MTTRIHTVRYQGTRSWDIAAVHAAALSAHCEYSIDQQSHRDQLETTIKEPVRHLRQEVTSPVVSTHSLQLVVAQWTQEASSTRTDNNGLGVKELTPRTSPSAE
jgi:hypothetical protein